MTQDPSAAGPLVAIVGRPNVGKSTLFNRLVGKRLALVHDEPGVTRDRRYADADWAGHAFRLVDTGGLDPDAREGILGGIRRQVHQALEEAALVLLVIDALEGPTALDREVAGQLRRLGKPVFVLANKVDSERAEAASAQAYELGFPEVFGVSAAHGRGMGELLDAVVATVAAPKAAREKPADEAEAGAAQPGAIKLALLGKPNVGKSSLVNRILGEDRVLVHEVPGTTRDPIDTPFAFEGQEFVIIDTAGIRKKRTSYDTAERVAVQMAERQVERADVVALIIDAKEGPTEQDARLAGLVQDEGRALLLCASKSDLLEADGEEKLRRKLREELGHVDWAPIVISSAQTGRNVPRLLAASREVYGEFSRRVATGELNRFFEEILARHPPPIYKGRPVRMYYITQAQARPPTFVAQANYPEAVSFAYRRYLVNQLRKTFGFFGTPVRLICRRRQRTRRPRQSQ